MNIKTPKDWWQAFTDNEEALKNMVASYHPCYIKPNREIEVTAPAAQFQCDMFSHEIRQEQKDDPIKTFETAAENGDHDSLIVLLNQTWFGVPENRDWPEGFSVLCDLCSESWVFEEQETVMIDDEDDTEGDYDCCDGDGDEFDDDDEFFDDMDDDDDDMDDDEGSFWDDEDD